MAFCPVAFCPGFNNSNNDKTYRKICLSLGSSSGGILCYYWLNWRLSTLLLAELEIKYAAIGLILNRIRCRWQYRHIVFVVFVVLFVALFDLMYNCGRDTIISYIDYTRTGNGSRL